MSLPAEHPRDALLRDEALLDAVAPGRTEAFGNALAYDSAPLVRWYTVSSPAVVIGLGLRHRLASIVDLERCRAAEVEVLERRAGGGALLLDEHMVCGAVCIPLPDSRIDSDVTESYRWLGDLLAGWLRAAGVEGARRVEVAEARADVATLKAHAADVANLVDNAVARVLLATCYGALSPHEVVIGAAKLVGIAQVRRRHAALFQFGILQRDQSPLADYLQVPDAATREELRGALRLRTVGLESVIPDGGVPAVAQAFLSPLVEKFLPLQTDQLL